MNSQDQSRVLGELLRRRRSVRKFKPEEVALPEVEAIFDDLRFMPCPTNRLCYKFLAIRNPLKIQAMRQEIITEVEAAAQTLDGEEREKFRSYGDFFTFFDKAPLVLVGLYRAFVSRLPSGDPRSESIQGLAEVQAFGGVVAALLLALEARQYASCWMTGPLIAENRILRLLEIESPWRLGAILPVGRAQGKSECPKKPEKEKIFSLVFDS